ncbi:MAG: peptidyl-tRNA hydrolase Pth2 [Nanoarchaeota archaeon]|nr:peptidyl-tRNA hydrolase Pth2 [Nanoarchaeota archaeon]
MKQVIVVRKDLKMGPGKVSAQVSHASVEAFALSNKEKADKWREEGMKKVVLKVNSLQELFDIKEIAKKNKLKFALIKDAGRTQIEKGSITCIGIGPDEDEILDKVTGDLKLL